MASNLVRKGVEYYEPAKKYLDYDEDSGELRWAHNCRVAGGITNRGYIHVRLRGTKLLAHRIVWYMAYGELPDHIDHINGCKTDNRLSNLRACSASENVANQHTLRSNNTSGCNGVVWFPKLNKWGVTIQYKGESTYKGVFRNKRDAIRTRAEAERDMFGTVTPITRKCLHTYGISLSQPTNTD